MQVFKKINTFLSNIQSNNGDNYVIITNLCLVSVNEQ